MPEINYPTPRIIALFPRQAVRLPYNHSSHGPSPRIPVWLHWEQSVIYFVTICVAKRRPVLANENAFSAFKAAAARLRSWTILSAILMPDHLHFIATPTEDREAKVGNLSAAIKRWMRQELNASWKWQAGSFDRLIAGKNRFRRNGFMSKKTQSGQAW